MVTWQLLSVARVGFLRTPYADRRPPDSGDLRLLTNNAGNDELASWSADGSQIAFTTDRDGDFEIYVMNADGSGQTNLTNAPTSNDKIGYPRAWR